MKFRHDFPASIAVFLVALPLCLGIALASGTPLMSGLIAGVIGGIVVGALSGSHTSVSGPAAGLVAIVLAEVAALTDPATMTATDGFRRFLLAMVFAGILQIALGFARAGVIAYFIPTSVIRGLLTAIGVILILKQLPYAVGYDASPVDDFAYRRTGGTTGWWEAVGQTTEGWWRVFESLSVTATLVTTGSLLLLIVWERIERLKRSPVPGALVAVVLATLANELLYRLAPGWALAESFRVRLSVDDGIGSAGWFLFPDWSAWAEPRVYRAAVTIAMLASLETLLNVEAADKLDVQKRITPANRELFAQGSGNLCCGLLGGLPITSVIVRSSTNIYGGAKTKASAVMHGFWLAGTVALIPGVLERIPLAALAAILLYTGYKLASPQVFRNVFRRGWNQFVPFTVTVVAIVITDLLVGVAIGLAVAIFFVLRSMERAPFLKMHSGSPPGQVTRLRLGQHVTFLQRARVARILDRFEAGSRLILDASATEYIDPDVRDLIREYQELKAPARGVELRLVGFREHGFRDTSDPSGAGDDRLSCGHGNLANARRSADSLGPRR